MIFVVSTTRKGGGGGEAPLVVDTNLAPSACVPFGEALDNADEICDDLFTRFPAPEPVNLCPGRRETLYFFHFRYQKY